jgi:methionyl-tRNA formyltransferase
MANYSSIYYRQSSDSVPEKTWKNISKNTPTRVNMRLKIIYAGTPYFALPALEAIYQAGHDIIAVLTQPDRPAGRGQKIQTSVIKDWAIEHQITVYQPETLKTAKAQAQIKALDADVMVVAAYGLILPQAVLDAPRLGCINIHHGILPEYRGTMFDLYAIFDERPAGFSIHKMESKIDDGVILLTKSVTDKNSNDSMNFPQHIFNSSKIEGIEMSKILKIIKDTNQLPIERENISSTVTYTKNPNYSMIREMKRKGMVL